MSKLTLSMDPHVVARAKRYAERRGVSLSAIVEAVASYKKHLVAKPEKYLVYRLSGVHLARHYAIPDM